MKARAARSFKELTVWEKAHGFVLGVYRMTQSFPNEERFGLVTQMRRAAVSIPANIAEGFRKRGKADKARYLNIAEGSLDECRYHLILSQDLCYGNTKPLMANLEEVSKLLHAYTRAILTSDS